MFTNGVEWAGHQLETFRGRGREPAGRGWHGLARNADSGGRAVDEPGVPGAHSEVGVGAIIGAPLMLSTLALFVMGIAAIGFRKRRGTYRVAIPPHDVRRDLGFFLPVFLATMLLGMAQFACRAARYVLGSDTAGRVCELRGGNAEAQTRRRDRSRTWTAPRADLLGETPPTRDWRVDLMQVIWSG